MLYLIGLGLGDEKDITIRGLEAVKKCSKVCHALLCMYALTFLNQFARYVRSGKLDLAVSAYTSVYYQKNKLEMCYISSSDGDDALLI